MPRFDPIAALRPPMRVLPVYEALEDFETLVAQYGVDPATAIKLDGNENPYGPSPRALEALRAPAYRPQWYGDERQRVLRGALAARLGVDAACVVAGTGSDELIEQIFRLYLDARDGTRDRIVIASPTFGMYAFDAAQYGVEVVDVPRLDDWSLDADALVAAAREAKAVFIPSPNNPTGGLLSESLADRLLESGALLVVDEAYIEFAGAESLARRAATERGLIVLRTMSKWGGLAGLRLGYAVMNAETADLFMRAKQPYSVNVAAEAAAIASLADTAVLDERACVIAGERERVADVLAALGWIAPSPSHANFLLLRLARGGGQEVREALRRRGIFTRHFGAPRLRDYLRLTIGTPEQNERVIAAFRAIGEELAP